MIVTLSKTGPWGENYKLTGVTATNVSYRDSVTGNLHFDLSITHDDSLGKSGCVLDITVSFEATSENYEIQIDGKGNPVFHTGSDFDAQIQICCD